MKSKADGVNTSLEVTNVSRHGLWVFWGNAEYFLDYSRFPWFKEATIAQVTNVSAESDTHLYWPDLDVDLSLKILQDPNAYPLVSKG
jgi:hypothetical protein